jgi:hypothetical protein
MCAKIDGVSRFVGAGRADDTGHGPDVEQALYQRLASGQ